MRLIPTTLLLLCSLAQATEYNTREECKSIYKCYATVSCTSDAPTQGLGSVIKVPEDQPVMNDCDVFFRIHAYSPHWVRISIESYKNASPLYVRLNQGSGEPEFACSVDKNGAKEGKYMGKPKTLLEDDKTNELVQIQCIFDVKVKRTETVFKENGDQIRLEAPAGKSLWKSHALYQEVKCDPSKLYFNKEVTKNDKKYGKVIQKLGTLRCEKGYQLEYKNAKSEYETIQESLLTCDNTKYAVNGVAVGESIDARCFADAKFFCAYNVATKQGKTPLTSEFGDPVLDKPSTLMCPPDKKFLVIKDTPILKYEFTCLNYGGTELWTVADLDRNITYKLSKTGPETYCTNELECHRMNRIPDSAIPDGFLNSTNLPQCHTDGVLGIGEKELSKIRCDQQSGKYKYVLKGDKEERDVHKDIIFNCTYAPLMDDEKNEANRKVVLTTLVSSISLTVLGGIAFIAATIFVSNSRIREMKRKAEQKLAEDQMAGNKYCKTDEEKQVEDEKNKEIARLKEEKRKAEASLKKEKDPDHVEDRVQEEKTAPFETLTKWSEQAEILFVHNTKTVNDVPAKEKRITIPEMKLMGTSTEEEVSLCGGMSQSIDSIPDPSPLKLRLKKRFLRRFSKMTIL